MNKKCPDCGEVKSSNDFYKNKAARDGLNTYCKACWSVRAKAQRKKIKDAEVESPASKVCPSCSTEKPASEFRSDKTKADHLSSSCAECISSRSRSYYEKNRDRIKARVAAYQKANPDKVDKWVKKRSESGRRSHDHRRDKYGITEEQYAEMLERAGGVCEICGRVPSEVSKKGACVDHCHDSGKVRGILCAPCNSGIGSLRDDPAVLRKAIEYLETHSVHDVVG